MRAGSMGKIMNVMNRWLAAGVAAALVATACGRKAPEGVLAYIPADTPYAVVNLEPLPRKVVDDWRTRFAPVGAAYEKMLARAVSKLGEETSTEARAARAVLEEMKGQASF
jgi:hypothetical protein